MKSEKRGNSDHACRNTSIAAVLELAPIIMEFFLAIEAGNIKDKYSQLSGDVGHWLVSLGQ